MVEIVIILYLAIILIIGLIGSRGIVSLNEYATAGKNFSAVIIFATLSASFIGGGFSMGNAEKVYLIGISNIVALWGFSLKEILVAKYIAPNIGEFPHAISVGDIIEPSYGKNARVITGIFSVMLCAGILGAQVGAIGYIFNLFLDLNREIGIIIGTSLVILYAAIGGMRAVIWTDVVQFIILVIGIPLTLYYGVESVGGWSSVTSLVPQSHFELFSDKNSLIILIGLFFTFLLGETLVPPYVQRLFIGKDSKSVSRGTLFSGIFSIFFFTLTGVIGIVALAMNPDLNANLAMPYVIKEALPTFIQAIVIAAIISIVLSSADSFLNASSISFINDIVKPLKKEELTTTKELFLAKVTTVIVGVLSIIFAISIESILEILIYAYNFWAPTILIPLLFALLGKEVSKESFFYGALFGIVSSALWNYSLNSPYGVDGLIIGVCFNYLAFITFLKRSRK